MRFRIYNRRQAKHSYALSKQEASLIKVIGLAGLISLALLACGFALFASQSWLIAAICGPFFVMVVLYNLINFVLMTLYPGFDTKAHRKKVAAFKQQGVYPKVAVLIPAAGEDVPIVAATVKAALKIRYPHFSVHILDDSKDGMYRRMAKKTGAIYFRRRNVGVHKKAGNLNAAVARLRGYQYTLVLDADFVARPEIIEELMPYAGKDVGIVQSPQHFDLTDDVYRRSKFEFGAALIQRDFYRITQVARNRFGAAICVGTNALYNIEALRKVGGYEGVGPKTKDWGHSEDVNTGLKMLNMRNKEGSRYRIEYVPMQLAKGACPSSHVSFYKQQNRWSTGSMQLAFSKKTLFSPELSIAQKLCYFSNAIYYFYTIGLLFTPVQLLLLMLSKEEYNWAYTLLFIPMLVVTYLLTPFIMRRRAEPLATSLVVISNAYTFAQALFLLTIRRPLGWEATGAKTGTRKSRHFSAFKIFSSSFFVAAYVTTFGVLLVNQRIGFNPSTLIISLFLMAFISHVVYLYYMLLGTFKFSRSYFDRYFYAYVSIMLVAITTGTIGLTYSKEYQVSLDGKQIVAIEAVRPKALKPATPQVTPVKPIEEPTIVEEKYEITAMAGDSQSKLAVRLALQVQEVRGLDKATTGKLQDKIMHAMGYANQLQSGTYYSFDRASIDDLLYNAYVYDHERAYWTYYAGLVGVEN